MGGSVIPPPMKPASKTPVTAPLKKGAFAGPRCVFVRNNHFWSGERLISATSYEKQPHEPWAVWSPPPPQKKIEAPGCVECDLLGQALPVSKPGDQVLWSSGSALTSCIMSRTVHHCPCVSNTVAHCGTCSGCHCWRVSAHSPLTALRRASVPRVRTMNSHGCVGMCACAWSCAGLHCAWVAQGLWWPCSPRSNAGEPETT